MNLAISGIDAAIVVVYLAAVVAVGLWIGRGQRDVSSFFLGERALPWWAVLLSIVATETSTVTFLSVPGLSFAPRGGDLRFLQLSLGFIAGRFLVVYLLLPAYFRGELFTAYQVLDRRFGGATKSVASLIFLVTRNLSDGLRLFLTAIVLRNVIHLDLSTCIVVTGAVTIVYTFAGGMKAVVWNDCVQFVIYIAGALLAAWVIVSDLPGGWEEYVRFGQEHDKFRVFDFAVDPTGRAVTFWAGLVGGIFLTMGTHGTDQLMVQRYLGARSEHEAARALAWSGIVIALQFALFLLIGVGLACFYERHPPAQPFARPDEVFPAFIADHLSVGAVGLVLAAVFSAAMSTLSSSLNSSATAAINDLYLPLAGRRPAERHLLNVSRGATLAFGVVQVGVALAAAWTGLSQSVIDNVLSIAGFATGLILGVFFLGAFTRRVTQASALAGLVGGLVVITAVAFGTGVNGLWYTVIGSLATYLAGCAASLLWTSRAGSGGGQVES